jgi:hypothetical protein
LGTERAAEFHSCSPARLKSCSERNRYVGFGLRNTQALLDVQSTLEIRLPAIRTMHGINHEPLLEERSDHLQAMTRTRQTRGYLELHRDDWMWEGPRRGPYVGPGPFRSGLRRSERETSFKVWSALDDLSGIYENSPRFFPIPDWRIETDFTHSFTPTHPIHARCKNATSVLGLGLRDPGLVCPRCRFIIYIYI